MFRNRFESFQWNPTISNNYHNRSIEIGKKKLIGFEHKFILTMTFPIYVAFCFSRQWKTNEIFRSNDFLFDFILNQNAWIDTPVVSATKSFNCLIYCYRLNLVSDPKSKLTFKTLFHYCFERKFVWFNQNLITVPHIHHHHHHFLWFISSISI